MLRFTGTFFILLFAFTGPLLGQRQFFQNFTAAEGLSQSQVLSITQDQNRHLWIGTYGGLDRFDGSSFQSQTQSGGLNSSSVTCLYTAANGSIWAGTFKGVSKYDGYRFINYTLPVSSNGFNIKSIAESPTGELLVFDAQFGLFRLQDDGFVNVSGPQGEKKPDCIYRNASGKLLASFQASGIYEYNKGGWTKFARHPLPNGEEHIVLMNGRGTHLFAFSSLGRVIKIAGDTILYTSTIELGINSSCIDRNGNIWLGTKTGVKLLRGSDLSLITGFSSENGLTDNFIHCLFSDAEGNVWIGSDGDGLYRYSEGVFARYDKGNGLPGNIIMGFAINPASDPEKLFIGIRDKGLVRFDLHSKEMKWMDYSSISKEGINSIAADNKGHLLMGTTDKKLLEYDGISFREIRLDSQQPVSVNSIQSDAEKTWFSTSGGCYYRQKSAVVKVSGLKGITLSCPLALTGTETIVGSTAGVFRLTSDSVATLIEHPVLKNLQVSCLARYQQFILIGTIDQGLFCWDRDRNKIYQCDRRNGLADNFIFSLHVDVRGRLWIGSGTSIQQAYFDQRAESFNIKRFSRADGLVNAENNMNAVFEEAGGRIWFGTTKGIFLYSENKWPRPAIRPYAEIQEVASPVAKPDKDRSAISAWNHLPLQLHLPYSENRISFKVKGIFLQDPESLLYSCQLAGYDKDFSVPSTQTSFSYQSLAPGNYVFRVKAITGQGQSSTVAEYAFTVARPFYKTNWFYGLILLAVFLTGFLAQAAVTKARLSRKRKLEAIRQEEQDKVRQQTAEDFHDELGNKLTRISLLTNILQQKPGTNLEQQSLIDQIQDNVGALYSGTREIIWSLSPGNDSLDEMLRRIRVAGEEIFQDTDVEFLAHEAPVFSLPHRIPMDYSRNLIMTCKEIFTNSLRHSKATQVSFSYQTIDSQHLELTIKDNGKGFDPSLVKKGNGLNNIQRRIARMGARISLHSSEVPGENGTFYNIYLKIPSKGG